MFGTGCEENCTCKQAGELPFDIEELRQALNDYASICEDNATLRKDVVRYCRTISGLRRRIGELMKEINESHNEL